MSATDIIILILVILLLGCIAYFSWIRPKIKGQNAACKNCPTGSPAKRKRLIKAFHKQKKKEEEN